MDTPKIFSDNDFVFAKMSGYPPWPAIVMTPNKYAPLRPRNSEWIYFCGSHNYAWIAQKCIKPYKLHKDSYRNNGTYKKAEYKEAFTEMDNIIENIKNNPDYEIKIIEYIPKGKRVTQNYSRKSTDSVTLGTPKRKLALKEKNNTVPKKKSRSSISSNVDNSLDFLPPSSEDLSNKELNTADIKTSKKKFGIWAANIYAGGIIQNLIKSGHALNIWSYSLTLCEELEEFAKRQQSHLEIFSSPLEVVKNSDIIISLLSDPDQPKLMIQEMLKDNLNLNFLKGKGYVEMTSVDPERSRDLSEIITNRGGIYLEAMVQGCREGAMKGELMVLLAGSKDLFNDCLSCFKAMAKATFLLGDDKSLGAACKIHLILQIMRGIFLTGVTEGFAMADKCGIKVGSFNKVFKNIDLASDYLKGKVDMIMNGKYTPNEPLQQLQKDLALGLEMSNIYRQPMPLASNANEILKHARRLGYDNQDASCIYNRTRY